MGPITLFLVSCPGFAVIGVLIPILALRWALVPRDRFRCEWMIVIAALAEPAETVAMAVAKWLSHICPLKYDLFIFRIDRFVGEPGFHLAQMTSRHLWTEILVVSGYNLLSAAMVGTIGVYFWLCTLDETRTVIKSFVLNLFAAVPFYLIIPVCGPAFAFSNFPRLPAGHVSPHPIFINSPPNGIPSVHASSALLVLWFLRRWRWGLIVGTIFLAITVVATLGSGEHYVFDLLCAVPYTAGVIWATHPSNHETEEIESYSEIIVETVE